MTMNTPGDVENNFCYPLDYVVDTYENEIKIGLYVLTLSFISCFIAGTTMMIYGDKNIAYPILIYGMLGMLVVVSFYILKILVWICDV